MSRRPVDLNNVRFGMLVAEYPTDKRSVNERVIWACRCDCGNIAFRCTKVIRELIKEGCKSHCGCLGQQRGRANDRIRRLTYIAWKSLNNRCNNPNNKDYKHYGAAGIKVCARWRAGQPEAFPNFLADMGEKAIGQSVGRFGDVGDYSPENCKWMTNAEQGVERAKKFISKRLETPCPHTVASRGSDKHAPKTTQTECL